MQPLVAFTGSPPLDEIGRENLFGTIDDALNWARQLLGVLIEPPRPATTPTVSRETPTGTRGLIWT